MCVHSSSLLPIHGVFLVFIGRTAICIQQQLTPLNTTRKYIKRSGVQAEGQEFQSSGYTHEIGSLSGISSKIIVFLTSGEVCFSPSSSSPPLAVNQILRQQEGG